MNSFVLLSALIVIVEQYHESRSSFSVTRHGVVPLHRILWYLEKTLTQGIRERNLLFAECCFTQNVEDPR